MTRNDPVWKRRIGDRKREQAAHAKAVEIARDITLHSPQGTADQLAFGLVLWDGEIVWGATHATLHTWHEVTSEDQVVRGRAGIFGGFHSTATAIEHHWEGWTNAGPHDWVVTNLRLVGRHANGELWGVEWPQIAACRVDLARGFVALDGSGWRARLTGPEVAPIAVVAVYSAFGSAGLVQHPGLEPIRNLARQPLEPAGQQSQPLPELPSATGSKLPF